MFYVSEGFCGFPSFILNGHIVSSTGVQGGDVTVYACNHGYTMSGEGTVRCLARNEWETLPTCTGTNTKRYEYMYLKIYYIPLNDLYTIQANEYNKPH